ncbi:MAG: 1-deoxy-D-xylulose-5-phosphate synthase [Flavobacteriales bacterium]|mgnify:FL=1|jgi:1-deoxy-D-xylulose-5-phosphate synthase|tara:strand:- start:1102 stop:3036 length:1935 start_codon:yes stop_codon:yes gene_type:complete
MEFKVGELLQSINNPDDLRKIKSKQLPQFCDELRDYIIEVVSRKGGHFGASLGVVELTAAIHYAFNTPTDQLVWDVGHQAYGHKIITGRRNDFPTQRVYGGLSGFPKRSESEYDTFGVGHSSTSISSALGMSVASRYLGKKEQQNIAVIGDGALTAGMAFEALNHGGVENSNLLVVLNDNCMSIDPNVTALNEYLTAITTSAAYNKVKDEIWHLLGHISKFGPNAQAIASKIENAVKSSVLGNSNLFESFNFRYFGPVDGHDVKQLVKIFEDLKDIPGPKILHILTKKGKGYEPAETGNQTQWHAPGIFNKDTGEIIKVAPKSPQPPKYQDVFGHTIVELAEKNEKIMGITPAMPSGSSLNIMMEAMPDRSFDVGIAEQHAVTFSAGLATQGLIPFCNIYSSFMQRAYDQVIHDVALQNLNVVFCLDRAGIAGADGPTHHGAYDIAYMRCIPNIVVSSPMNEEELRNLMYTSQLPDQGPFSIRYPRGKGMMVNWKTPFKEIKIGTGRKIKNGEDIAILSLGHVGNYAVDACEQLNTKGIDAAHYDMRFAKPLDSLLLHEIFGKFSHIITVEDGCVVGGIGTAIAEFMLDNGYSSSIKRLGIPDSYIEHGTQEELHAECKYDANAISKAAQEIIKKSTSKSSQTA